MWVILWNAEESFSVRACDDGGGDSLGGRSMNECVIGMGIGI